MIRCSGVIVLALAVTGCGSSNNTPTAPSTPTTPTPTQTTFNLTGQVTDSSTGSGISNANVAIADGPNTGKSTTTDGSGNYAFTGLQQSGFTVNASANNYVSQSKGVTLTSNQILSFQLVRSGPRTSFGAGQFLVGTDIAAGRYFSSPSNGCYWERESGLGGTLGEIVANDFIGFNATQWIVDISPSDKAFKTQSQCGTWFKDNPRQGAQTNVSQGMWLIGSQVSPGTYRTTAQDGCYWERLRDFGGNLSGIIANDFVSGGGPQLVTIGSGDTGFDTNDKCGTWTRSTGQTTEAEPTISIADIDRNRRLHRMLTGVR